MTHADREAFLCFWYLARVPYLQGPEMRTVTGSLGDP